MIIFDNMRIKKIKELILLKDFFNFKKENFIKINENGWGIYNLKKKFFDFEGLTDIIIFSLPNGSYIAHEHLTDMDEEYYHYILKCNDNCGIIVENEYLPYRENLLFGFNPMLKHIVWNYGNEARESLVFIFKNKNLTLEEWRDKKNKIARKEIRDTRNLNSDEIKKMTEHHSVKIL